MKIIIKLMLALLLIAVVVACRKTLLLYEREPTDPFLLAAKNYYYLQSKRSVQLSSRTTEAMGLPATQAGGKLTPVWQKGNISKTRKLNFVEVPVINSNKRIVLFNLNGKPADERSKLARVRASFQRLLIYETPKKRLRQLLLTYIPDYDYLKRRNYAVSHNQINKLDYDFSGYILYSSVKSRRDLFLLQFENGRLVKRIKAKSEQSPTVGRERQVEASGSDRQVMGWEEVCVDQYETPCIAAGDPPVETCHDPIKVGEFCYWDYFEDPGEPPFLDPCEDPENFYICFPENPDPTDPDPDPNTPNPPEQPLPVVDPCFVAQTLAADSAQKAQMNDLKNKVTQNYEAGYYKLFGSPPVYVTGTPNTLSWNPPKMNTIPIQYLQYMNHSHYNAPGSLSIFSGNDIDTFAKYVYYKKTIPTFQFSVTTSQGTTYTLMVENHAKFRTFFNEWMNPDGESTSFITVYADLYVKDTKTVQQNENALAQFLQEQETGIVLLKANANHTNWGVVTRDENGKVTIVNCN